MARRRILFADDQLPRRNAAADARVKAEVCAQFERVRGVPPEETAAAFDHDHAFFTAFDAFLDGMPLVEPVRVTGFLEAERRIAAQTIAAQSDPDRRIDAAVIDLSWWGDPDFPDHRFDSRHNRGFELLALLDRRRREDGVEIPAVAWSQNFLAAPDLMRDTLQLGALPVPKLNGAGQEAMQETGFAALMAAIEHQIGDPDAARNEDRRRLRRLEEDMRRKQRRFELLLVAAFAVVVLALGVAAVSAVSGEFVALAQALVGAASGGVLALAARDQRASTKDFMTFLETLRAR